MRAASELTARFLSRPSLLSVPLTRIARILQILRALQVVGGRARLDVYAHVLPAMEVDALERFTAHLYGST